MNKKLTVRIVKPLLRQAIESHCPRCNYGPLDGVQEYLGEDGIKPETEPTDGRVTICSKCRALLKFATLGGKKVVRALNRKEIETLKKDKEAWAFIELVRNAGNRPRLDDN